MEYKLIKTNLINKVYKDLDIKFIHENTLGEFSIGGDYILTNLYSELDIPINLKINESTIDKSFVHIFYPGIRDKFDYLNIKLKYNERYKHIINLTDIKRNGIHYRFIKVNKLSYRTNYEFLNYYKFNFLKNILKFESDENQIVFTELTCDKYRIKLITILEITTNLKKDYETLIYNEEHNYDLDCKYQDFINECLISNSENIINNKNHIVFNNKQCLPIKRKNILEYKEVLKLLKDIEISNTFKEANKL